jgi:hypothetical protein
MHTFHHTLFQLDRRACVTADSDAAGMNAARLPRAGMAFEVASRKLIPASRAVIFG